LKDFYIVHYLLFIIQSIIWKIVDYNSRGKRDTILEWFFKPHPCKYEDYRGKHVCVIV